MQAMASIARDKNGCRRNQFVAAGGKRLVIRLGKVSQRTAESTKYRVEQLVEMLNYPRAWTRSWHNGLPTWNRRWQGGWPSSA